MSDPDSQKDTFFSVKSLVSTTTISVTYLFLSYFLVGYKIDQVVLVSIFNVCYYLSAITRKFFLGFSAFVVFWIIYDYMKAFPNYQYANVHIADLYNFEKSIFGIHVKGIMMTPNEYLSFNDSTALDVMCGFFYLCWIPVPMLFAVYLFFTRRKQLLLFWLTFVLVNFLGFVVYYTYPAAPPWYVAQHGFVFLPQTHGNTAGLARFDAYYHVTIFKSLYAKGSNVFAAMPSLHSAYPFIVSYYAVKNKLGYICLFFITVTIGIWFAAVYLSHHYVIDVLAGITCAVIGISLFNALMRYSEPFKRFITRYEKAIQ